MVVSTEDTDVGYMVEFDATKRQVSIAPHAQMKTRNFIAVRGFPVLTYRQGLASWNINILCHQVTVDCCVCLHSILYLPVELVCACFLSVPLITPCIVFVDGLNACDDSLVRQLIYTGNLHAYDRQLKKGMI